MNDKLSSHSFPSLACVSLFTTMFRSEYSRHVFGVQNINRHCNRSQKMELRLNGNPFTISKGRKLRWTWQASAAPRIPVPAQIITCIYFRAVLLPCCCISKSDTIAPDESPGQYNRSTTEGSNRASCVFSSGMDIAVWRRVSDRGATNKVGVVSTEFSVFQMPDVSRTHGT